MDASPSLGGAAIEAAQALASAEAGLNRYNRLRRIGHRCVARAKQSCHDKAKCDGAISKECIHAHFPFVSYRAFIPDQNVDLQKAICYLIFLVA
jgi:hypothetical protein